MRARVPQLVFLICSLIPAICAGQEVIVLKSFPGDSGPGPKDNPDNTGGVGPSHVVDCTDANIVIHDKKTGEVVQRMTQTEFWKNAQPGFNLPRLNDPRMTYDPLAGAGTLWSRHRAVPRTDFSLSLHRWIPPGAGRE